jgi:hypothetical protein
VQFNAISKTELSYLSCRPHPMQPGEGIYKSKQQTWPMEVTYKRKTQAYYRICPFSEHYKSVIFKSTRVWSTIWCNSMQF